MLDPQRVTEVAEAVADGRTPDWPSVESSATDPVERGVLAKLRAVQAINSLYTTRTGGRDDETGRPRLAAGDAWGGLEIREHVGRGRFGDVYRAWDPALDREVALKIVRHSDGRDSAESRIVDEGRLMARVRHPNVVTIHGAQRLDGVSGLVMEFVEGRTLAYELAERGSFAANDLAHVGIELGRAVAAVHRAGLVHRDVKAQNVLRDATGRIVLGDFGTGREFDESEEARGGLAGTPAYLAPEIFAHQPATPQSDLYSLGALLFHLATGRFPVAGRSLRELRDAHTLSERTRLAVLRPDLPAPLITIVDRALDPDPRHRFADADEMVRELKACLVAIDERRDGRRRRSVQLALAAMGLAALASAAWMATRASSMPAVPFKERDFVLVAAVDNQTGESVLDGTLEYALVRELSSSSFVNVVPPGRMEDALLLMRKRIDTRVDASLGREIALRDGGIRVVIAPRVLKLGGVYSVSADVVSPADGAILASVEAHSVEQGALLSAMRQLSVALRERLGESLPIADAARQEHSKVTTTSLRALNLYSQVAIETDEGLEVDLVLAEQRLRAALQEDPDFASAHMKLSIVLRHQNRLPEALQAIEHAVALSDRVTEVERLVNIGELHAVRGGMATGLDRTQLFERAAAAYEAALQLDPDNYQALVCLTNISNILSRPGASVATRLADLRPRNARWQVAAATAILLERPEGRDAARPYVRRSQQLGFSAHADSVGWARTFDAYDAWLRNDAVEASRIADALARELRSLPETVASRVAGQLYTVYLTLGRFNAASEMAAASLPVSQPLQYVRVAVAREDRHAIRERIAHDFPSVNQFFAVTVSLIASGQLDKAQEGIAFMKRNFPANLRYVDYTQGLLALAEGRVQAALDHLERLPRPRETRESLALARALAGSGRLDEAILLLEDVSKRRAEIVARQYNTPVWEWLSAREVLAQLYRRAGRHLEADAVEIELRKLLEVADDDHPMKRRLK